MLLTRSMLAQLAGPFLLAVAGFLVVLIFNSLYFLADLLVSGALGPAAIGRMLVYLAVPNVVLALPMAWVLATLLVLGRMARDGEITALRALGVGHRRIVAPVLVGAALVAGLSFWLNDTAAPAANVALVGLVDDARRSGGRPMEAANVFFRTPDGRAYCFAGRVDRRAGRVYDVLVDDRRSAARRTVTAPRGTWDGEAWRLEGGVATAYDAWGTVAAETPVAAYDQPVGYAMDPFFALRDRGPREKPAGELARDIAIQQAAGGGYKELEVEYYMKLALPMSAVFVTLLAAPLGARLSRLGGMVAVALSLSLIMAYQTVLALSNALGVNGVVDPMTGAWLQNWIFGSVGLGMLWWVDR